VSESLLENPFAETADNISGRGKFLLDCYAAAKDAGHIWPIYAACEGALDSEFGTTEPAVNALNLFSLRAPARVPAMMAGAIWTQTVNGRQYDWLKFSSLAQCFTVRMEKLRRFSCYYQALRAKTGRDYILEVSKLWSQDPARPQKVFALAGALAPSIPGANLMEMKL
jgi:hypothetical protein